MRPSAGQNGLCRLVSLTSLPPARTWTLSVLAGSRPSGLVWRPGTSGGYNAGTYGVYHSVVRDCSDSARARELCADRPYSVTALIPAFFGAVFVILALVARNEAARKHAMHAAVALALIGLLATLARVVPALAGGNLTRPAVLAQLAMTVLLGVYIALGVKSFKEARRARLAR